MKHEISDISVVVPTKNEEKIIEKNLRKIHNYLKKCNSVRKFEILVCDFSTDSTPAKAQNISKELREVRYVQVKRPGIGAGIREGFSKASFRIIIFYPIDMSWNTRVIENSIKAINHGHDVALGSRAAAGSSVKRALNRRIFSFTYNIMLRILFGLDIGDTQGTVAIKKSDLGKYEDNLLFDDPFLQTEILIHSRKLGLNIVEIPVNVTDTRKESKIRPVRTGLKMSSSMLKKFMSLYF